MNIDRLEFRKYALPLKHPVETAKGPITGRRGFILWLWDREGRYGLGEAAPLPFFSRESLADVAAQLQSIARDLRHQPPTRSPDGVHILRKEFHGDAAPSVRFALGTALLDLQGKQSGQSVREILTGSTAESIALNGLIGLLPPEACANQATRLVRQGFATLKLKLGHASPEEDFRCVEAVSEAVGRNIPLRLDPNQAWDRQAAERLVSRLADFTIEYLEQPVCFDGIEDLRAFRDISPIPVALDDMSADFRYLREVIEARATDAVVLKPTMLGEASQLAGIIELARERQVKTVFTSAFESVVGLAGVAQLAAALAAETTHGLATGMFFSQGFLSDHPYIVDQGRLQLPVEPGLGLALEPKEMTVAP